MKVSGELIENKIEKSNPKNEELDWTVYALKYDLMCDFIPAYQENIDMLLNYLDKSNFSENISICDLGAGTGNFISAMATTLPNAHFTHVDSDHGMTSFARKKYQSKSIQNIEVCDTSIFSQEFKPKSFDLIVCINALYAMKPQDSALCKIRQWLKPDGKFFVIDWGRENQLLDWIWYITRNGIRNHGFKKTISAFIEGAETVRQNKRGKKGHQSGQFWRHTTEEFQETLENSGFKIEHIQKCYRGYSDLAVCSIDPTFDQTTLVKTQKAL